MKRAFSDFIVHSSNIDDTSCTSEEDDPIVMSGYELNQHLTNTQYNKLGKSSYRGK